MYNINTDSKKVAKACRRYARISWKACVEIGKVIKGMKTDKAKKLLQEVVELKKPIPFRRFNRDLPHRKGKIAAGRYPVNASKEILSLIESAEKNAENLELDKNKLYIKSFLVMKAPSFRRPRKSELIGQRRKNVHISIILEER